MTTHVDIAAAINEINNNDKIVADALNRIKNNKLKELEKKCGELGHLWVQKEWTQWYRDGGIYYGYNYECGCCHKKEMW